jgi:non-canonical (house-cleaning) NTP pyrophosphatase
MQKIIVASQNPVKLNAALHGFEHMFPEAHFTVEGFTVESGVNDQPIGRDETLQGAYNRLEGIVAAVPDADYWVGIEGGIEVHNEEMEVLPPAVAAHINDGKELGTATDIVFSQTNSKQSGGSIGELTGGLVDRTAHYDVGVIFALIPFKNPELYPI